MQPNGKVNLDRAWVLSAPFILTRLPFFGERTFRFDFSVFFGVRRGAFPRLVGWFTFLLFLEGRFERPTRFPQW